mmetsp:Transcript_13188/g.30987  ORF Transcript_13188/g.30987 Transcript_13188/m.30987 type:complete len:226 (+) Transcript_13188:211-888(+)
MLPERHLRWQVFFLYFVYLHSAVIMLLVLSACSNPVKGASLPCPRRAALSLVCRCLLLALRPLRQVRRSVSAPWSGLRRPCPGQAVLRVCRLLWLWTFSRHLRVQFGLLPLLSLQLLMQLHLLRPNLLLRSRQSAPARQSPRSKSLTAQCSLQPQKLASTSSPSVVSAATLPQTCWTSLLSFLYGKWPIVLDCCAMLAVGEIQLYSAETSPQHLIAKFIATVDVG